MEKPVSCRHMFRIAVSGFAGCAPRNRAVDHDEANRLFRRIIRGLNARRGDKPEAGLALSENRLARFRAGIGPAHFFWQLVVNLAIRQCLSELLDAFVGDLRILEVKYP